MSLAVGFRIVEAFSNLKVKVYLPPGLEYISLLGEVLCSFPYGSDLGD